MKDYNSYYLKADNLLREIAKQSNQRLPRKDIPKFYNNDQTVEILLGNDFIQVLTDGGEEVLHLNGKGTAHLNSGGFKSLLCIEDVIIEQSTFRQTLEGNTNLLTIFGILNAVLLFASQGKEIVTNKLDLVNNGMLLISMAMYILSIVVLLEIISTTFEVAERSWKYYTYSFCLGITTLGIGLIFIEKHQILLLASAVEITMIGCLYLVVLVFIKIIAMLPGTALMRVKGKTKILAFILWTLALAVILAIFELIKYFFG